MPDDAMIIPLAMTGYGFRRIAVPLFAGKMAHTISVALLSYLLTGWAAGRASADLRADLGSAVLVAFLVLILYQVEKNRGKAAAVPQAA